MLTNASSCYPKIVEITTIFPLLWIWAPFFFLSIQSIIIIFWVFEPSHMFSSYVSIRAITYDFCNLPVWHLKKGGKCNRTHVRFEENKNHKCLFQPFGRALRIQFSIPLKVKWTDDDDGIVVIDTAVVKCLLSYSVPLWTVIWIQDVSIFVHENNEFFVSGLKWIIIMLTPMNQYTNSCKRFKTPQTFCIDWIEEKEQRATNGCKRHGVVFPIYDGNIKFSLLMMTPGRRQFDCRNLELFAFGFVVPFVGSKSMPSKDGNKVQ